MRELTAAIGPACTLGLVLLIGGCSPTGRVPVGQGPPTAREVGVDPATARDRLEQALREDGFTVRRDDDATLALTAENADAEPAWADCPLALARDPDADTNRQSFERPIGQRTVLVARFTTPAGRTTASLDILQVAHYRNPYVGLPFEERCRSTGVLEARLLDAAQG
jgi:hypothetical protein